MRTLVFVMRRADAERRPLIARTLTYGLLVSHGIRVDARLVFLIIEDDNKARRIVMTGAKMRHLRADEGTAWGIFRRALRRLGRAHWGVHVSLVDDAASALRELLDGADRVFVIGRGGIPLDRAEVAGNHIALIFNVPPCFIPAGSSPPSAAQASLGCDPPSLPFAVAVANWILDWRWGHAEVRRGAP